MKGKVNMFTKSKIKKSLNENQGPSDKEEGQSHMNLDIIEQLVITEKSPVFETKVHMNPMELSDSEDENDFHSEINDNYSLSSFKNLTPNRMDPSEDSTSLRKRSELSEESENNSESVFSEARVMKKRINKLKNFWRGTSLFYPFCFQKEKGNHKEKDKQGSFLSFFVINDLSRKIISFSNKIYI